MKLIPIITEHWKIDGGVAFGVIPRSLWSRFVEADVNNLIHMVNRCLLVQTSDRLVLIETGFGNKRDSRYYQFKYIAEQTSLEQAIRNAGFEPTQITDVIFTHLHDDHCGGAVNRLVDGSHSIVCPNAQHWVSKTQWESAMHPNKREAAAYFTDNVMALHEAALMRFVENEGEIIPGISVLIRNGHTAGQMLPLLDDGKQKWVYSSDFIPSLSHVVPVWIASVDIEPILALAEKEAFLEFAEQNNIGLIFEHDFHHSACLITKTLKGFEGQAFEID
jgi:glyoxylase-like metal-dependent hydrolase (beta-lactamase superfamily II)